MRAADGAFDRTDAIHIREGGVEAEALRARSPLCDCGRAVVCCNRWTGNGTTAVTGHTWVITKCTLTLLRGGGQGRGRTAEPGGPFAPRDRYPITHQIILW